MSGRKYDALKLENQICFPLYACSREVIKKYRPYLNELGLTYTQYITMMVFWEHGTVSAKEIGERLFLDSGTLTPVLKSLEAKGLVRRYRSKEDERVLMAELTDQGKAMRNRAVHIPQKLSACMGLEPEEAQTLYTLLYKLLNQDA